jgi:dTDP-4-amino-4,6-dideoxygalactose transaminase
MPNQLQQRALIEHLASHNVPAATHFQPLHSSEAGERLGRSFDSGANATEFASRIVRLPMHANLEPADVDLIIDSVTSFEVRA